MEIKFSDKEKNLFQPIVGLWLKFKNSPNRDNYVLALVIIWALFLIIYTTFFEYRWLNFPNWK